MMTDKLYTGQQDLAQIGLYDFHARFYDPLLKRFVSADTLVPNPANPQALNRYSYALNSPLRFIDPSGHRATCNWNDPGPQCYQRSDSGFVPKSPKTTTPTGPTPLTPYVTPSNPGSGGGGHGGGGSSGGGGVTITQKAEQGDISSIVDLVLPTHGGVRWQFEISIPVKPSAWSLTIGGQMLYNRKSDQLWSSFDISPETGVGAGSGGSLTVGPVNGWGASDLRPIMTGVSGTGEASGGYLVAATVSGSIPLNISHKTSSGTDEISASPYIDPVTGQIPATSYYGGGLGGVFGGGTVGPSFTLYSEDDSTWLPWHWWSGR